MFSALKKKIRRIPTVDAVVRRLGLSSQGSWLFRRYILEWTERPEIVEQLPLPYRAFARYAATFFERRGARNLPGGRVAFNAAAIMHRLSRSDARMLQLHIDGMEVVVDLRDPRFLQVVNELAQNVDTAFLSQFLQEGDTFIDVGANHGAFAIVASRIVGPSGRVIAFEPQPHLAKAVERSLSATGACPNSVHAVALGDREGTIDLLIPRSYSGTAGVFEAHSGTHPHRRVAVPLRRFDDLVKQENLTGSVFIKLDVEGSEYVFLRGAEETIRRFQPTLLMELNNRSLRASATSKDEVKALLQELGYTHFAELDTPATRHPLSSLDVPPQASKNVLVLAVQ